MLIIDDQFTSRLVLEKLVLSIDDSVVSHVVEEPLMALTWLQDHEPDLILTDYKLPNFDGVELTRRIRSIPRLADVPIIMVTSSSELSVRYEALESGATDFLTKPVDHHECRARCRNLLMLRHQQLLLRDKTQWLEIRVSQAMREVLQREQETLLRLAKAGEYRDQETGNHVMRMSKYSRLIAEGLGLSDETCATIEVAAPMHDIGKIGVPDHILLKPGPLSREESTVMQNHAMIGYEILKGSPSKFLTMGATIARGHHEKWDGSGYPDQIGGKEIPIAARIVAVADVFDALTSARPYKKPWSIVDAVAYLNKEKGSHFDPDCVDAFLDQAEKISSIQLAFADQPFVATCK